MLSEETPEVPWDDEPVDTEHPCQWCGYGAAFTTHNLLAHGENGDPLCSGEGPFGEDNATEEMWTTPWRDWYTYYDMHGWPEGLRKDNSNA